MNELLASRYAEIVHRLAVGIEPRDALSRSRIGGAGLAVTLESPLGLRDARPLAHAGGRWSIRYVPALPDHVDLRIDDPARRFVPRRMRFPVVSLADVKTGEASGAPVPAARRTWRPLLFPGAAHPLAASATGLRGRVVRDSQPVRWARVEARLVPDGNVLWRAHGDDRGEFLLVVGPDPRGFAELPSVMQIWVSAFARKPSPSEPAAGTSDPLWDMPVETVAPPTGTAVDDPVALGQTLPQDYDPGFPATSAVDLIPGRIRSDVAPFVLD
jgi:hypothetical protein